MKYQFFVFVLFVYLYSNVVTAQTTFRRTYHGLGQAQGQSIWETFDGGYIVGGSTTTAITSTYSTYLIKINNLGEALWTRVYDFSIGNSVRQTKDGGYFITGGHNGGIMIKTNTFGDTVWTKTYHFNNGVGQQTSDGGYIIAGGIDQGPEGATGNLLKIDSIGNAEWMKVYDNFCRSVQQTIDGGYIINTWSGLIKTNSIGDTLWTNDFVLTSVQQTHDGGYIGVNTIADGDPYGITLWRFDSSGNRIWEKYIGLRQFARFVEQTSDGGYIISTWSGLVKTNSFGDTIWTRDYRDFYSGAMVRETSDGGYIIVGGSIDTAGRSNICIIKTKADGIVSVLQHENNTAPEEFTLFQNYPNPFNPSTQIRFTLRASGFTSLKVYDLLGREVAILVNEEISAGTYDVPWKADGFASGVYFYQLHTGGLVLTKKLLLSK